MRSNEYRVASHQGLFRKYALGDARRNLMQLSVLSCKGKTDDIRFKI